MPHHQSVHHLGKHFIAFMISVNNTLSAMSILRFKDKFVASFFQLHLRCHVSSLEPESLDIELHPCQLQHVQTGQRHLQPSLDSTIANQSEDGMTIRLTNKNVTLYFMSCLIYTTLKIKWYLELLCYSWWLMIQNHITLT